MGNFNSDRGRRFGGRSSGGRSNGGGFGRRSENRGGFGRDRDSRRPREMHDVTCDKCGKQCQVPFKPSGDKPVLCRDCFRKGDNPSNNFGSRDQAQLPQSGASLEQFNQINKKLDKIILILQNLEIEYDDEDEEEDSQEEDDGEDDADDLDQEDETDEEDLEDDDEDEEEDTDEEIIN